MSIPENIKAGPGPGSLTWKYFGDTRNLLLSYRVGTLQAMHPAISAALIEHSDFFDDPLDRLIRSAGPILGVIFDPDPGETGLWIRGQHTSIKGVDANGKSYHALSPEVYYWAHATFFEGQIKTQDFFGQPLTDKEKDQLYYESIEWYSRYGLSMKVVPESYEEFKEYWRYMVDEVLEPTRAALEAMNTSGAHKLPNPVKALPDPLWIVSVPALSRLNTWLLKGLLPEQVRDMLGVQWTSNDEFFFRRLQSSVRTSWPHLPYSWRRFPKAVAAERRV